MAIFVHIETDVCLWWFSNDMINRMMDGFDNLNLSSYVILYNLCIICTNQMLLRTFNFQIVYVELIYKNTQEIQNLKKSINLVSYYYNWIHIANLKIKQLQLHLK